MSPMDRKRVEECVVPPKQTVEFGRSCVEHAREVIIPPGDVIRELLAVVDRVGVAQAPNVHALEVFDGRRRPERRHDRRVALRKRRLDVAPRPADLLPGARVERVRSP